MPVRDCQLLHHLLLLLVNCILLLLLLLLLFLLNLLVHLLSWVLVLHHNVALSWLVVWSLIIAEHLLTSENVLFVLAVVRLGSVKVLHLEVIGRMSSLLLLLDVSGVLVLSWYLLIVLSYVVDEGITTLSLTALHI